jgi:hypothetical protein
MEIKISANVRRNMPMGPRGSTKNWNGGAVDESGGWDIREGMEARCQWPLARGITCHVLLSS